MNFLDRISNTNIHSIFLKYIDSEDLDSIKDIIENKKLDYVNRLIEINKNVYISMLTYAIINNKQKVVDYFLNDSPIKPYFTSDDYKYNISAILPIYGAVISGNVELFDKLYKIYSRKKNFDIFEPDSILNYIIGYSVLSDNFDMFKKIIDLYIKEDKKSTIFDHLFLRLINFSDKKNYNQDNFIEVSVLPINYIFLNNKKEFFDYIFDNFSNNLKKEFKDFLLNNQFNILSYSLIYSHNNLYYFKKIIEIKNDILNDLDLRKSYDKIIKERIDSIIDEKDILNIFINSNFKNLDFILENYQKYNFNKNIFDILYIKVLNMQNIYYIDKLQKYVYKDTDIIKGHHIFYHYLVEKPLKNSDSYVKHIISNIDYNILDMYKNDDLIVSRIIKNGSDIEVVEQFLQKGFIIDKTAISNIFDQLKIDKHNYIKLLDNYRYQTVDGEDIYNNTNFTFINKFVNYDETFDFIVYKDVQKLKIDNIYDNRLNSKHLYKMIFSSLKYNDIDGIIHIVNVAKSLNINLELPIRLKNIIEKYIDTIDIDNCKIDINDKDKFELLKKIKNNERLMYSKTDRNYNKLLSKLYGLSIIKQNNLFVKKDNSNIEF